MERFQRIIGLLLASMLAFIAVPTTVFANANSRNATEAQANPVKTPIDKVGVFNPYYLLVREEDAISKAIKKVNPKVKEVTVKEGSSMLTLKYGDTSTNTINLLDFISYRYNNGPSKDIPELPDIYNGNSLITKNPTSVAFFRGDTGGNTRVTVKLQNYEAKKVTGVANSTKTPKGTSVFANNIAAVQTNSDGTPYVEMSNGPKGWKITDYLGDPLDKTSSKRIKPVDVKPYRYYEIRVSGTIALDAELKTHITTFTVFRAGNKADKVTGTMKATVLPLADKYEPVFDMEKNSAAKPLELNYGDSITPDQIKDWVSFKVRKQASKGDLLPGTHSLPEGAKFVIDPVNKNKPGEVQEVRVRVVYKDNQITDAAPEGDSFDTFMIHVRAKAISDTFQVKDPVVTKVVDLLQLSADEMQKVEKAVRDANPDFPAGTEVAVGENGGVTVTFPDRSTASLEPVKTVVKMPDTEKVNPNNPAKSLDSDKAKKVVKSSKQLPKTGADFTAIFLAFILLSSAGIALRIRNRQML